MKRFMAKQKRLKKYKIRLYKPEDKFKIKKEDAYPYIYDTALHISKSHGFTGIIVSSVLATSNYMIKAKKKLLRILEDPKDNKVIVFKYKDDNECNSVLGKHTK